ncbi:hypothetical protein EV714DRAFT_240569, partial [Schizophyllum commune]
SSVRDVGFRDIRCQPSTMLVIVRPTIISDPAGACKIDARTVLNVGDTPLLTSTSSPALPCFDTDVRTPTFNVLERTRRPSRRPPSSPVTPPPSSPSTLAFSTTLPTLPTSLNSTPSTSSSLSWPSSRRRSLNLGGCVARGDTAHRRRQDSTSETASQDVVDDLDEPPTSHSNASCSRAEGELLARGGPLARMLRACSSRAGGLLIDHIEDSHVDIAARTGLVDIALRAGLVEREGVSVKGRRRSVGEGKAKECRRLRISGYMGSMYQPLRSCYVHGAWVFGKL